MILNGEEHSYNEWRKQSLLEDKKRRISKREGSGSGQLDLMMLDILAQRGQ